MLHELHISNLALIDDARIELRPGLNCFTGQTGAGKSMVLGALELLLGLRSGSQMLRDGAAEGRVSGVFELKDPELARRAAELADLEPEAAGGQLLITRKLFSTGRTSYSINGSPATAPMVRAVGELLVDVHGQHDHQYLLRASNQVDVLDRFGGCEALRNEFARVYRQVHELQARRAELDASATLRRQQLELYEFQAEEIDKVAPVCGEYEETAARHKLLSNLQRVQRDSSAAHAAIYEAEGSVLERLQAVVGILRQLSEIDEELSHVAESVRAAASQVQDAAFDLSRYIHRIELDAGELAEVAERLNALNRLIHKYGSGASLEEVLAHREQIGIEIQRLRKEAVDCQAIDQHLQPLRLQLLKIGGELTARRQAAARALEPLVERELAELGMPHAEFAVQFEPASPDAASPTGLDTIEMLVQPNPGQPPCPLRKIASGGELSRIMLAIKSILAGADKTAVLVFDEIDANIGGRIGSTIGAKLRGLARCHQVLCITHLPQIAAYADHHVKISKTVEAGQTCVQAEPLTDSDGRITELAEMLTGQRQSQTTRKQAQELLAMAGGSIIAGTVARKEKSGRKLRLTG